MAVSTEEWFGLFRPGVRVRFQGKRQAGEGLVLAQWRGPNGYWVRVRADGGGQLDIDPASDELELLEPEPF